MSALMENETIPRGSKDAPSAESDDKPVSLSSKRGDDKSDDL